MNRQLSQILPLLLLGALLFPTAGIAAGIGAESPPDQSVNDSVPGQQIPVLPQVPEIKFHEAGAPQETQGNAATATPDTHSDRIKVIYDSETEQERGKTMALIIAFGVSLALNIFLATSLFSARRKM
jgi:hypothetical protein